MNLLFSDYTVLILGAGIAGVRAAQILSEAGANIQIIEGSHRIGGIYLIQNRTMLLIYKKTKDKDLKEMVLEKKITVLFIHIYIQNWVVKSRNILNI